ncbi:Hypothetical predicted protein [Lecanosticta acicola]|uniref:SAC3/GANP/THP3 conserved domain-containing protein n=1 Tax=Lecanosticta acicola TaxID=111012 RepID=A0AAI9EBJ6_9PEZI|nr:Hypothetical predicted protein [Lecanosticta acicola]
MPAQPAFTPVAARRTLMKEPAPAPTKTDFQPEVVDYVQRAFFEFNKIKGTPACAGINDDHVRDKLSSIVNNSAADGSAYARDWSLFPLPHELLLQERSNTALRVEQDAILANINASSDSTPNHTLSPGSNSRKRKSPDQEVECSGEMPVTPPWKKKNTKSLADRITGKSKDQDKKRKENGTAQGSWFDTSSDALERRRQRFGHVSPEPSPFLHSSRDQSPAANVDAGPIIGTCQILEKSYFRLTAPPNPSTVRPPAVLEKALEAILKKWKEEHDYTYVCDQLKSVRQDLTVQRIKTPFTIRVYEMHARIALEMKDLGEYNQCQTQLRALYRLKLGENGTSGGRQDEFTAYRILYLIYTRSRADMNNMLADLTTADKKGSFVQLALKVRAALASGNYHRFFQLYSQSQNRNMVPYLMDMFIERERLGAMAAMCRAYKPDVSSLFLTQELAFECEEAELFEGDVHQACLDFVARYSGDRLIQPKDDDIRVLTGKAGNIFEDAKKAAFGSVDIKGQI